MPSLAPSPSSSDDVSDDQSDGSNAPPPKGQSRSSGSSSKEDGDSSSPSPGSGGSRSSDSQDSSSSDSRGSRSSSSPPPSKSSPSPWSSPSRSSRDGDNSDSSSPPAPPSGESSSGDNGDSDSSPSPSPPPPTRSPPPPQQSEDAEPSPSPSSPRSPPSPPPPPANHSVVFIPVVSSSHPGAPPGLVAIAPPGAVGVLSAHLPGAQSDTAGGMQPGSSGSTSSGSTSSSQLHSSQAVNGQLAAAIAGAAVAGLLFVMIAIFFVVTRKRKKDGLVYHTDGSYYMHSGQLMGSNHPSGVFYGPPPPGASGGFSYGPLATPGPPGATDSFRGAGYYRSGSLEQPPPPGSNKSSFSYEELTSITSNFARDNVIGEGGFGCVYKGWLADGKCVAVKQLKAGSGQGEREFQAEVEIISRVHHRHLVSLVGYCVAQHHRMLIYEFVPNGTLEHHLHGRCVPVMDWPTRLRIAIGAAKGLAYLHEDCHPRIIHRDIKSANILLDYSFEAQVADFGLAKLSNDTHTHVSTRIMGTFGYLAPEYASSGKLTDRSDVFSFGVVLLELITGRKPVDQEESLVEWARPVLADAIERGEHDDLVDPRLQGRFNKAEMVRMVEAAAACVRHSAPKRPRMVQVMRALDVDVDEGSMSDLSNGVKVGQSQVFSNGQQEAALEQLRRTAFASEEFTGEFEPSREYGAAADSDSRRRPAG